METILIYDSEAGGHRTEYIEYFIEYLHSYCSKNSIIFLINQKTLSELVTSIDLIVNLKNNIKFIGIDDQRQKLFSKAKSIRIRSNLEANFLVEQQKYFNIDKIVFLYLDLYQVVIAQKKLNVFKKISGILFEPYVQLPAFSYTNLFVSFRKIRKRLQLEWLNRSGNIDKIFIFNSDNGVKELNGIMNNVHYLPDPISKRKYQYIDIYEKFNIEPGTKILLFVGGIQPRKNLLTTIRAFKKINTEMAGNICFLILGKCNDVLLLNKINKTIEEDQIARDIIFINDFVSNDLMESSFAQCEAVILTYYNFFASSGIIGNAAKHGKKILATEQGVIGEVVKKYNLGLTVDTSVEAEITKGFEKILLHKSTPNEQYLINHNFDKFCNALLV